MVITYAEEIRRALGPDRPVRVLTSTGSTNEDALAWAGEAESAPEGACVVTDQQLQGRGRWGRSWTSAPGKALMFSLVLRPTEMPADRLGLLTSAMGVACAEAIGDVTSLAPTIKWPNDVNIRSRKVAGILFESQFTGHQVAVVVAGVGVNTHWSLSEIPEELRDRATSLAVERDDPPPRGELLGAILDRFDALYLGIRDGSGVAALIARADEMSDLKGRPVEVTWPDGRVAGGVAGGLATSGGLNVQIEGQNQVVDVGEVTKVRSATT
jgi:BirA family biotin operon repressor/biotin-[acetyl-CoA-carboxylase] ligase